ncbi:hypothetical protein M427DRAFT_342531 [Gonapodya prolifera JEL478]|uniref:Uncharacterized protein n=1 Tax=Gonapodya prolifera (strain JEL478) TaxID=1344416 RepID=A0A139AVF7_GONPJ|nr:hypothetical protein M427DRAFT_342531 [Gonapodya prolifera JEL478]|eukprot:KXS20684.1 hypothetical protein M427DRAFT_342531 [Gonapodya prolifera JEL478]
MLPTAPSTMPANAQGVSRRMESSTWALSPSMTAGAQNIVSRRVSVPVTSSMLAIIASGKPNGECPPPQHSKSDTVISGRTATHPSSTSSATTFMTTPLSASIVSVYSAGVLPRPVPVATRDTAESSDGNGMDVRGPFTSPPGSGPQF